MNFFPSNTPYMIAEVGVNHGGDIDLAKSLIEKAAAAGAHAVKFQTYKSEKLAAKDSPSYWDLSEEPTKSQFELFQKYDNFQKVDYEELANHCDQHNVAFVSTPFDLDCLDWLIPLMPFVKIASADITNALLLEAVAWYQKPIVLSVGASNQSEISTALDILEGCGVQEIVLLHCILQYPTPPQFAFLEQIDLLKENFGARASIGYSDHVKSDACGNDQLIAAAAKGALILEKHFTHDKQLTGNDHYHAMDEFDLHLIMNRLNNLNLMQSRSDFKTKGLEIQDTAIRNARRSLHFSNDLYAGHTLEKNDLIALRPGTGITPSHYESLIGRRLEKNVNAGKRVEVGDFE